MSNSENILLPKKYKVLSIEKHTEVEWNFRIECDFEVKFGQFVEISLPLYGEAPISISDYGDGYIDLLIRKIGKVTGGLFELDEGDYVWMRGVHGNGYPLDEYKGKHLIVIAGGTGTAPVKGLMNSFCENPEQVKKLDMILGFKNTDSVLYKDYLQKWAKAQNLIVTLDEGEADDFYKTGRVTEYIADLDLSDKEDIQLIVVGPPMMIKFVVEEFVSRGLEKSQIWVDYERKMACAVGKCGHCRIGSTYICLDGPIFRFDKAQHLVD